MKLTTALLSASVLTWIVSARIETGLSPGTVFRELDPMFAPLRSASLYQDNTNAQFTAPWHLDRIDQRNAQLDHIFTSQVRASCDRLSALKFRVSDISPFQPGGMCLKSSTRTYLAYRITQRMPISTLYLLVSTLHTSISGA